jgi:outer membrane protein assembly factor BamB/predicted MPP superfamily phosphohydrolase
MDEFGSIIQLSGTVVDTGGQGVAGVAVANGELIICTNAAGAYEIEIREGIHRFLSITVPQGYRSTDGYFRRLHNDERHHTFTLDSLQDSATEFSVAHITDLHLNTPQDGTKNRPRSGYVLPEDLATDLAAIKHMFAPDFVIATGDLTEDGSTAQLQAYHSVVEASGLSIFAGFGTHDGDELLWRQASDPVEPGGEIRDFLDATSLSPTITGYFETIVGPTYYSFDYGAWHFVIYPNEHYAFSLYDQVRKERWLEADLSLQPEARPIVIGTHMPPRREWLDQLAAYDVRLILHGHTHSSKVFNYRDMLIASTPALGWGGLETNPRGYRALHFNNDRLRVELRSVGGLAAADVAPQSISTAPAALRLVWETKLPAHVHRSAPVMFGGDLLVSLQDEDDAKHSGVCCVRQYDGSIIWRVHTDSAVRNSVAVAAGGELFALSFCGRLARLDAATGATVWYADTHGFPERWTATAPAVADGVVYVGAKSGYAAYDVETGKELWSRRFSGSLDLLADPIGDKWGAYYTPIVYQDLLITLVSRRGLVALQRDTGRIVWERPLPQCQDYWASPVLAGDLIVSGGEVDHMLVVQARSGDDLWHERVLEDGGFPQNYVTGIAVDGGRLYAGACDGHVMACELYSGKLLWRFQTGPNVLDMAAGQCGISTILAPPVLYNGQVVACGVDAVLYLLNAETGMCQDQTPFDAPITAAPVVLNDGLCVATWDGWLRRFSAE